VTKKSQDDILAGHHGRMAGQFFLVQVNSFADIQFAKAGVNAEFCQLEVLGAVSLDNGGSTNIVVSVFLTIGEER